MPSACKRIFINVNIYVVGITHTLCAQNKYEFSYVYVIFIQHN